MGLRKRVTLLWGCPVAEDTRWRPAGFSATCCLSLDHGIWCCRQFCRCRGGREGHKPSPPLFLQTLHRPSFPTHPQSPIIHQFPQLTHPWLWCAVGGSVSITVPPPDCLFQWGAQESKGIRMGWVRVERTECRERASGQPHSSWDLLVLGPQCGRQFNSLTCPEH